jgi:hypothetical protein
MASEQFSQAVRGSGGQPIQTSNIGSIDTNDYQAGDAGDEDGSAYPYSINPAETIKEFVFVVVGAEIEATVTTTGGDTFSFPVPSTMGFDRWDIDSVELSDPNGSNARVAYWWVGEA